MQDNCTCLCYIIARRLITNVTLYIYGVYGKVFQMLQRIKTYAARLVMRFGKTPVHHYLQWPPVVLWWIKVLLYIYNNGMVPDLSMCCNSTVEWLMWWLLDGADYVELKIHIFSNYFQPATRSSFKIPCIIKELFYCCI